MRILSNRGFTAWLALFALGLQMVAAFGHVHLEGIARTDLARATAAGPGGTPQSFVDWQPGAAGGNDNDAYCPICASVYLTANSFVPAGPVLQPPSASTVVEHINRNERFVVTARRPAFQSRAPPLA